MRLREISRRVFWVGLEGVKEQSAVLTRVTGP